MEVKLLYESSQVPERDLQQINIEAAFCLHLIQDRAVELTTLHTLVDEISDTIGGERFNIFLIKY